MSFQNSFNRLRSLAGNPTMTCVKPRSEWGASVPGGYSFDADYDRFVNASNEVWSPTYSSLPSDTVNVLPQGGIVGLDLEAGGLVDTGDRSVFILPADQATVDACHLVLMDSVEYDVEEISPFPGGGATLWYTVRLRKR